MIVDQRSVFRKAYLVNLLTRLCAELDIPEGRLRQAQERYEGAAEWLAAGEHFLLRELSIYLQGSTALGTSVKPIGRNEHDVDLVAFMPAGRTDLTPAFVKAVVGDRLKANAIYARLLEEKCRCWRLVYANEFHLDITPAILNSRCRDGGEFVPDRSLREWKGSNPRGYRRAFERRAALVPRLRVTRAFDDSAHARADIEPFPTTASGRNLLCNIVQVAKRHRDVHFDGRDPALTPISVILTTLLAWSYEACVAAAVYDTEFDLMIAVLRRMPDFIRTTLPDGSPGYWIPNETTLDENFAERWNDDPRRARAFYTWHTKALADMEGLALTEGTDRVRNHMEDAFGPRPVERAFATLDREVATARGSGVLRVAPLVGVTTAPAVAAAVPVRANTFFGRDCR
ncbi:nucleotidyltransferase [Bosea sp. UNC402CLCol]|uniref:nucleotidyltransferase domain-containing protein n=1 Tax=Bosea sp. UNC402CLCol TaxID=1510531 RepID=UPI00056DE7F1|nr:nucleotidyltransferase [Bosea sp. UNC402CLCol]